MNSLTLVGRVGQDPKIRVTSNGMKTASFSLATTEIYSGEKQTEWHNVVFFSKQAELVEKYVTKGSLLGVIGKIHYDSYEKEGVKFNNTQVIGMSLEFLGSKSDNQSTESAPKQNSNPVEQKKVSPTFDMPATPEDDLPF